MKKILFIAFALLIGMTGCKDDDLVSGGGVSNQPGEEIQFGAVQSPLDINDLDNPGARTHYGFLYDDANDLTKYPIYWDNEDIIAIYSPEATVPSSVASQYSEHEMDYKITIGETDDKANAGTLTKIETNGLQWTDATDYNFYAFYPSSAKLNYEINSDPKTEKTRLGLQLNLPTSQPPKEIVKESLTLPGGREATGYVARPNMDYCYMYAHTTYNNQTGAYETQTGIKGESSAIRLDFKPIVTTMEFIIHGPGGSESIDVSQVVIRSAQAICGDFNLYIDNLRGNNDGHTEAQTSGTVTNQVTIPLYHDNGSGDMVPVTLTGDEVLIVRAFLLPYEDVDVSKIETAVTVHMVGGGTRTKLLKSTTGIQKHKINIAELPVLKKSDTNYWQSMINENVYFSQLSMPGSHNAYNISSTDVTGDNTTISQYYQTLSVQEQLEAGARAFSFQVGFGSDIPMTEGSQNTGWLANDGTYPLYVYEGGTKGDKTLANVIADFATALSNLNSSYKDKYPESPLTAREFIVLNVNFNQYSGTEGREKEIYRWMKELDYEIDNHTNKDMLTNNISPETTIGELGNKILIFVNNQGTNQPNISFTYRTGSFWEGYETKDYSWSYDADIDAEKYMVLWKGYKSVTDDENERVDFGGLNDRDYDFLYRMVPAGKGLTSGINIWRQNLERLNNSLANISGATWLGDRVGTKTTMMEELFNMAIENNKLGVNVQNWYINNLGSFCVVDAEKSYDKDHGQGGNTVYAANLINREAYNYLASGKFSAPCGIVLMNFYGKDKLYNGNTQLDMYGVSLPQMIIENNYRFALKAKESGSSSGSGTETTAASYNSSMAKGGTGFGLSWSY